MNDSYYTPPQIPPQEPKKPANVVDIVALVLGILSLVCGCCCGFASLPFGIGAIVCAVVSRRDGKMGGMAVAGLILGIVASVFGVLGVILSLALYSGGMDGLFEEMEYFMDGYGYYGY